MIVAAVLFVPLLAIALATLIWTFGGSWPIRDKALLPKAVLGTPGIERMPRLPSLLTSILSLAAGILALALADHDAGGLLLTLLGVVVGALFVLRGALGFTPGWRASHAQEPFATLDRKNYSPLSLILGAGFLLLVVMRLL